MLVFEETGKRSTRKKPRGAQQKTNKLNPHMTSNSEIEPGPHWREASALTTAPFLHPQMPRGISKCYYHDTFIPDSRI